MATRENQGLQIALIIFVMLTIILIVTTFVFFRSYEEEQVKNKTLAQENTKHQNSAREVTDENMRLKQRIGINPEEKEDVVQATVNKDMDAYGNKFPESQKNYRHLVEYLGTELRNTKTRLAESTARERELADKVKVDENSKIAEIGKYTGEMTKIADDLEKMRKEFDEDRGKLTASKTELKSRFDATRDKFEKLVSDSSTQIKSMGDEVQRMRVLNTGLAEKIRGNEASSELPDGKITAVDQRIRLAWINVGYEDALRRETTFSVYDAGAQGLTEKQIKAKVEVVRVLGPHQAETRILDDTTSNPIVPGDQIASPVWQPGRAEHFALAGFMDINGDGISDRKTVKDLIALNGGVIDAEVGDDGEKTGQMTVDTKYLVRGQPPHVGKSLDKKQAENFAKGYTAMLTEAQLLGVRQLSVEDFVERIGYKPTERTVELGSNARPEQFKPRQPEGVQRKSGQKSEVDSRRAAPRTNRSMYYNY